jgi:hypothetical protein
MTSAQPIDTGIEALRRQRRANRRSDARIDRLRGPARQLLVNDRAGERPEWAVGIARAVLERSEPRDRFRRDWVAARDLLCRVAERDAGHSELSRESCLVEVDALAAHRNAFSDE